jgi:lysophospholipase L1-like esterase
MTVKAKWLFLLVLIVSNIATGYVVQRNARPKDDRPRDLVNALARMGSVNGPFVVILGDSITQNARLPETVCGMPLINAGTGGSRASTYIPFAEEMRAQKISPSLVVIALGTNDAISGYGTDFIPAYELLIRSLPASSLAFATPPPVDAVDGSGAGILNMTTLRSIDLAIKEIAASQKATLIDLGKIVGMETSDGIHPKKTTYPIWIKAVVQGIEAAMKCKGVAVSGVRP